MSSRVTIHVTAASADTVIRVTPLLADLTVTDRPLSLLPSSALDNSMLAHRGSTAGSLPNSASQAKQRKECR